MGRPALDGGPMRKLIRAASMLTLVALALMMWSVFQPTPMPVMLAMSLGQALGTGAFAMFGLAILVDLRRSRRIRRDSGLPPLREVLMPPDRMHPDTSGSYPLPMVTSPEEKR
jgi:hypothetical protein